MYTEAQKETLKRIEEIRIIPVIAIDDAAKAVPLAKALVAGGLPAAEVTFRTAAAEDAIRAIAVYREYFSVKGLYENEVYPGIPELLESLKAQGKTVVLATSKPEKFAVEILRHFGLYDYFDIIAGASMDESRNKKADVIAYAISQMNAPDLSHLIMIGDREHDILGAKQMGIDSIGVLYGYGDRPELTAAGADHIVASAADILTLV